MGWRQALGESTGGINFGNGSRYFLNDVTGYTSVGWYNLDNTTNQGIFDIVRGSISASSRFELSINTSANMNLIGRSDDGDTLEDWDTATAAETGMHHWASVFDFTADTMTLYKDGVFQEEDTGVGFSSVSSNTPPYYAIFGGHDSAVSGGRYTKGALHDLRIYKRALSANEIQTIYASRGTDSIINGLDIMIRAIGVEGDTVTGSNVIELGPNLYEPIGTYGNLTFEADNLSFRRRV